MEMTCFHCGAQWNEEPAFEAQTPEALCAACGVELARSLVKVVRVHYRNGRAVRYDPKTDSEAFLDLRLSLYGDGHVEVEELSWEDREPIRSSEDAENRMVGLATILDEEYKNAR